MAKQVDASARTTMLAAGRTVSIKQDIASIITVDMPIVATSIGQVLLRGTLKLSHTRAVTRTRGTGTCHIKEGEAARQNVSANAENLITGTWGTRAIDSVGVAIASADMGRLTAADAANPKSGPS
jgi:hypothetical protein